MRCLLNFNIQMNCHEILLTLRFSFSRDGVYISNISQVILILGFTMFTGKVVTSMTASSHKQPVKCIKDIRLKKKKNKPTGPQFHSVLLYALPNRHMCLVDMILNNVDAQYLLFMDISIGQCGAREYRLPQRTAYSQCLYY